LGIRFTPIENAFVWSLPHRYLKVFCTSQHDKNLSETYRERFTRGENEEEDVKGKEHRKLWEFVMRSKF
jgi:hypothetical protein